MFHGICSVDIFQDLSYMATILESWKNSYVCGFLVIYLWCHFSLEKQPSNNFAPGQMEKIVYLYLVFSDYVRIRYYFQCIVQEASVPLINLFSTVYIYETCNNM